MKTFTHIVFDHDGTLIDMRTLEKKVFPGMLDVLKLLKESGVKMYVWTARSKESALDTLAKNGIESYFSDVCGGNNAASKPSPAGIEYLISEVNPQNVIVIGDSIGDIIGGQKFGATSFGAMWGHGSNEAFEIFKSYGAESSFREVKEFEDYLRKHI